MTLRFYFLNIVGFTRDSKTLYDVQVNFR